MSFRLKTADCNILECLAEYRVLTASQLAALFHRSKQTIRRRLRDLEERGLIEVVGTEFGRGRGRPENSLGLTERGIDVLKEKTLLAGDIPYDKVLGDSLREPSYKKGHEVVSIPADVVHLIDEEDEITLVAGELGLDSDHHLLQGNTFLVSLARVEQASKVIESSKARPWI